MSPKINSNILKKNNLLNWSQFNNFKKKEEVSFFLYKNSVIFKVLKKKLNNFKFFLVKLKIFQTDSLLHIYLTYFHLEKKTKQKFKKQKRHINNKRSLFIKNIIKVLDSYTKYKVNFYIITRNIQKYCVQLNYLIFFRLIKKKLYYKNKKHKTRYKFIKFLILMLFLIMTTSNSANLLTIYLSKIYKYKTFKKEHLKIFKIFKSLIVTLLKSKFSVYTGLKIIISGRLNGLSRARKRIIQHGSMPLNTFNVKIYYGYKTAFTINGTIGIKAWLYEKNRKKIKKSISLKQPKLY